MLVLARRPNQVIHIYTSDGLIEVHLNDCNTYQARLGFVAPPSIKIMREEIDDLDESARCASKPEDLVQPQRNTTPSLLRALFTRGSTGRQ
jgi:sRNA-binding carbon storage regulator CsrA